MVLGMSLSDAYNSIVIDMVNARVGAQRELIGLLKDRGYETSRSSDSRGVADIVAAKVGPSEADNRKFKPEVVSKKIIAAFIYASVGSKDFLSDRD